MTVDATTAEETDELNVVGIGTSASGLEALDSFFGSLSPPEHAAFFVVQHLSPDADSHLSEILQDKTPLKVQRAENDVEIEAGHVYVIPPDTQLAVRGDRLVVDPLPELDSQRHTIDHLFRSLGAEFGYRSTGILLSGAGSDGTAGLREIQDHGGVTMAQDPDEAGFRSMPEAAIDAGVVDIVLPVAQLAEQLGTHSSFGRRFGPFSPPFEIDEDEAGVVGEILTMLEDHTGNNFSQYKRPTLLRRLGRRIQIRDMDGLREYRNRLRANPDELDALFDEISITVTRFFRDPEVWESIQQRVVPQLFEGKSPDDQVRIWVPGCSSGEEAYTIATLLSEYADGVAKLPEIKIFATDINEASIETARAGIYPPTIAADVPPEYLERYFFVEENTYRVRPELRRKILFAVHNALSDPPFSNLDFISCRNLLIYLQPSAQKHILRLLHYGLRTEGFLLLGSAESTVQAPELFDVFDDDVGLHRKRPEVETTAPLGGPPFGFQPRRPEPTLPEDRTNDEPDLASVHRRAVLESHAPPSVLVDDDYRLLHAIGNVGSILSVPQGTHTEDLLQMFSEATRPGIRTLLFEAFDDADGPLVRKVPATAEPGRDRLVVEARPVEIAGRTGSYVELSFRREEPAPSPEPSEETSERKSRDQSDREVVAQLERELEETRERLQQTIQEYETSNDKLRASNEELLSMNEELQSTTEELETSKEELQSMNEELTTVNEELNHKLEELDDLNSILKNLLRSTDIGTIFLNRDLEIERFTEPVTEYFNILASDEGRPFDHITHELTYEDFVDDAERVLDELVTLEHEISSRDGETHLLFRALPYLTVDDRVDGVVLTFIDITRRREIQNRLQTSESKFRTVFESAAESMLVYRIDPEGSPRPFDDVNGEALRQTGLDRDEIEEMTICDLLGGNDFDCASHLETLAEQGEIQGEAQLQTADADAASVPVEFSAKRMQIGETQIVVEVLRDVTDRQRYERAILQSKERAEELAELRSMFLSTLSHDVRSPLTEIISLSEVLQNELEDEPLEYVDRIGESAEQLRTMLDGILRSARIETNRAVAEPEKFDLVEHLETIVESHRPLAAGMETELNYEGPTSPVHVHLDPHFLQQALDNLIDDALRESDDGVVTLQLDENHDDEVRIEIVDAREGLSEEEREEFFKATDGDDSDVDIDASEVGLAVTELLVDSMHGEISVQSTPDTGTRIAIQLPVQFRPADELHRN